MFAITLAGFANVLPASVDKLCIAVLARVMPRSRTSPQAGDATRMHGPRRSGTRAARADHILMAHPSPLLELTDHELSSVTGGFLPLLGLIGMGANLAGSIMGGIGKRKAQEAQQITAATAASQGEAQPAAPAAPAPAAGGDLLAPRAPTSSDGGG